MTKKRLFQALIVIGLIVLNVVTFGGVKEAREDDYHAKLRQAWMDGGVEKTVARTDDVYAEDEKQRDGIAIELDSEGPIVECNAIDINSYTQSDVAAELVSVNMPENFGENEFIRVEAVLKNTGNTPWYGFNHPCGDMYPLIQLGNAESPELPHRLWNDFNFVMNDWSHNEHKNRIELSQPEVLPGEKGEFSFWIETPITQVTSEVNIIEDEESGEETKDVKKYQWAYERYTFNPVVGDHWLEVEVPLVMKLGKLPPKEAAKLRFLNAKRKNYDLAGYKGEKNMYVRLSDQTGFLRYGDNAFHSYKISSGAWDTKTPIGNHKIHNKQELRVGGASPHYRMPYWMGLRINGGPFTGYGLHEVPYLGESRETSEFYQNGLKYDLGKNVSHGCVRSSDVDAPFLFEFGELNMPVYVRNNDDKKVFATIDPPQKEEEPEILASN